LPRSVVLETGSTSVSATKTVAAEEKPFVELEELKGLPNNVAIVLPSNGDRTLPATMTYLRPLWVFTQHPQLTLETPWFDWPESLRATYDLDSIPQELGWSGWDNQDALDEDAIIPAHARLGRFIQPVQPPSSPDPLAPGDQHLSKPGDGDDEQTCQLDLGTPRGRTEGAPGLDGPPPTRPTPPTPIPPPSSLLEHQPVSERALLTSVEEDDDVAREGHPFDDVPSDDC
jgi:hypothetical protein